MKKAELTGLHITHGMWAMREKQGLKMLPTCQVWWMKWRRSEILLPGEGIQAAGPVREREQVHLGAHCCRSAGETPGEDPPQAAGCVGLQPRGEVRSGEVWPVGGS